MTMREKLCVTERRIKILDLLSINKQMTRCDLANEFNVSPITVKDGNGGGVYLESDFRQYSRYLTDKEENCLYTVMDDLNDDNRDTIKGIIVKFTKNTAFTNQST